MGMVPSIGPVAPRIAHLRDKHVILDVDLARLFGVSTKRLNQQVRRNLNRFPRDFAFQLNPTEVTDIESSTPTLKHGGRRKPPFAFTEHGVVMAANVLNSSRAVTMSIQVVRAFVELRKASIAGGALSTRLEELARLVNLRLDKQDVEIDRLFKAVEALIAEPTEAEKKQIGFTP